MHATANLDDIKKEIEDLGHIVTNIWNIKKQDIKKALHIFYVELKPKSNKTSTKMTHFSIRVKFDYCRTESCLELFSDHSSIIFIINNKIMTISKLCTLCNVKTEWLEILFPRAIDDYTGQLFFLLHLFFSPVAGSSKFLNLIAIFIISLLLFSLLLFWIVLWSWHFSCSAGKPVPLVSQEGCYITVLSLQPFNIQECSV